jgi:hypothetical protein
MAKEKEFKAPKNVAQAADRLFTARNERLKVQHSVTPLKEEEKHLTEYIINTLPKSDASGVAGKLARVSVTSKDMPTVKDWAKLFKFVAKNNAWHLLGKTINSEAVQEMLDKKKKVPGIELFKTTSVSLNKL